MLAEIRGQVLEQRAETRLTVWRLLQCGLEPAGTSAEPLWTLLSLGAGLRLERVAGRASLPEDGDYFTAKPPVGHEQWGCHV